MELLEFLEVSRFFGKVQQVTGKHCPVKLLTFEQSNKKDIDEVQVSIWFLGVNMLKVYF